MTDAVADTGAPAPTTEPAGSGPQPDAAPAPAPAQPATPAPAPAEKEVAWYDALPDDLKNAPGVAKHHSGGFEQFVRSALNNESLRGVPTDKLARIPDQGDREAMREYLSRLGGVETADDFKLAPTTNEVGEPLGDNFSPDGPLAKTFANACFEAGLPPAAVQPVFDACNRWLQQQAAEQGLKAETRAAERRRALEMEHGNGLQTVDNAASFVAQELGIFDALVEAGVADEPRVVNALYRLAPMWAEHNGGALPTTMGGTATKAELNAKALQLQQEALSLPRGNPRAKQLQEQALKLRQQASGFSS